MSVFKRAHPHGERKRSMPDEIEQRAALGGRLGFTASQVALAWALEQPFPVYACFGARTAEQVREAFGALDVDRAELAALTE